LQSEPIDRYGIVTSANQLCERTDQESETFVFEVIFSKEFMVVDSD
jgi:hypothetical protein